MSIDLNGLSARELESLIVQAKKRKTTLSKRKPLAVVKKKVAALARAEGYSIAELFGGAAPKSAAPAAAGGPAVLVPILGNKGQVCGAAASCPANAARVAGEG